MPRRSSCCNDLHKPACLCLTLNRIKHRGIQREKKFWKREQYTRMAKTFNNLHPYAISKKAKANEKRAQLYIESALLHCIKSLPQINRQLTAYYIVSFLHRQFLRQQKQMRKVQFCINLKINNATLSTIIPKLRALQQIIASQA